MGTTSVAFLSGFVALFSVYLGHLLYRSWRKRKQSRRPPETRPVTVDDWILSHRWPSIEFELPYSPGKNESVTCRLRCSHNGNNVYSDREVGASAEDALQKAVAQIERTIGTGWRRKRSLQPNPAEVR